MLRSSSQLLGCRFQTNRHVSGHGPRADKPEAGCTWALVLPHTTETLLPRAGGHFCWPLAGGRRDERCWCHVRQEICIRRMFAPWKIAWDWTLPISLPIRGHESQANELPATHQACLAMCPMGGYGCVTPTDCLDPRDVPTERSSGPQASPNGLYRLFRGNRALGAVGRRTPIPTATTKE